MRNKYWIRLATSYILSISTTAFIVIIWFDDIQCFLRHMCHNVIFMDSVIWSIDQSINRLFNDLSLLGFFCTLLRRSLGFTRTVFLNRFANQLALRQILKKCHVSSSVIPAQNKNHGQKLVWITEFIFLYIVCAVRSVDKLEYNVHNKTCNVQSPIFRKQHVKIAITPS